MGDVTQIDERRLAAATYQAPALTYGFAIQQPRRGYLAAKRALDLTVAATGLVVAAPLMLLVALAVLTTGRPVLFRQVRLGEGGRPFTVLKFRTMHASADPYAPKPDDAAPTITGVGRVLRATGLDELPQLINVLLGQMSLVGPRPEMRFRADRYDDLQRLRLDRRPGVTGLWQISPVRRRPIHDHIEYDLFYMAHQSMLLDLWIILRTPLVLLLGRHAVLNRRFVQRWGSRHAAANALEHRVVLDVDDTGVASIYAVAADL